MHDDGEEDSVFKAPHRLACSAEKVIRVGRVVWAWYTETLNIAQWVPVGTIER